MSAIQNKDLCAICLQDLFPIDHKVCCNNERISHTFHLTCVNQWAQERSVNEIIKCPVCTIDGLVDMKTAETLITQLKVRLLAEKVLWATAGATTAFFVFKSSPEEPFTLLATTISAFALSFFPLNLRFHPKIQKKSIPSTLLITLSGVLTGICFSTLIKIMALEFNKLSELRS